jgi:hypothetical protein
VSTLKLQGKELDYMKKKRIVVGIILAACLAIALPLALTGTSTAAPRHHGHHTITAASLPGFSPAMMKALNNTDVAVSPSTAHPAVSAEAALNAAMADGLSMGGTPLAIQLIDATGHDHPVHGLVWAVSIDPRSLNFGVPTVTRKPDGSVSVTPPSESLNLQVDFVSATTGEWLQDIQSYSPLLPPLKAAP